MEQSAPSALGVAGMLDTLYRQLFRPGEAPPSLDIAGLIGGVLLLVMTFNAAANLQLSASGLSPLLIIFTIGGFLGFFWFAAALYTLSTVMGTNSNFQSLLPSILVGLWPLIFSGAALSMQKNIAPLGGLFSLGLIIGTVFTLSRSIAASQAMGQGRALVIILIALLLSAAALVGIVVWPLMLLLGL